MNHGREKKPVGKRMVLVQPEKDWPSDPKHLSMSSHSDELGKIFRFEESKTYIQMQSEFRGIQ